MLRSIPRQQVTVSLFFSELNVNILILWIPLSLFTTNAISITLSYDVSQLYWQFVKIMKKIASMTRSEFIAYGNPAKVLGCCHEESPVLCHVDPVCRGILCCACVLLVKDFPCSAQRIYLLCVCAKSSSDWFTLATTIQFGAVFRTTPAQLVKPTTHSSP